MANNLQKKARIEELDYIKGLAILAVVLAHTLVDFNIVVLFYWVHMPIFFIVSGYTLNNKGFTKNSFIKFLKKKVNSLYLPFLYYSIPILLIHNILYNYGIYEYSYDLKEFGGQLIRNFAMSIGDSEFHLRNLWFLKVLFLAEIYYALSEFLRSKFKYNRYWQFCVCIIAVLINTEWLPHVFLMNLILPLRAMFFFLVGQKLKDSGCNKKTTIAAFVLFIVWIAISLCLTYEKTPSINTNNGLASIAMVVFSIGVFIVLFNFSSVLKQSKYTKWVSWLGRNTMPLFILHPLAFALFSVIIVLLPNQYTDYEFCNYEFIREIPWWIYFFVGIILSYVIWLCTKSVKSLFLKIACKKKDANNEYHFENK